MSNESGHRDRSTHIHLLPRRDGRATPKEYRLPANYQSLPLNQYCGLSSAPVALYSQKKGVRPSPTPLSAIQLQSAEALLTQPLQSGSRLLRKAPEAFLYSHHSSPNSRDRSLLATSLPFGGRNLGSNPSAACTSQDR